MSACNHSGNNEAAPNVSDEEPVENGLAKEGSTQPKQPAGSDQVNDSCEENKIAHLSGRRCNDPAAELQPVPNGILKKRRG